MSEITVPCPSCSQTFRISSSLVGRSIRCKTCQISIPVRLPEPAQPQTEATAPAPEPVKPRVKASAVKVEEEPEEQEEKSPKKRKSKATRPRNLYRLPLLILMGGYFPFLAAVCLGGGGFGIYLLWTVYGPNRADAPLGVVGSVILGGILVLTCAHLLLGCVALFKRSDEKDHLEIELPDEWQPGLAKLVEEVSEERGLDPPDVIRIHAASIAHVYQDRKGKQVLVIGGTAIAALPKKALAGVVAHELSHFTAGDTAISRQAARLHGVMIRLEVQFLTKKWVRWNPLTWVFRLYHFVYALLWFANQRAEEYLADYHEIEHVGKEHAAATLVLISVLETMEWTNLGAVAEAMIEMNQKMDRIFHEQVRRIKTAGPTEWSDALKKALRGWTRWYYTHPCLEDRLAAIGVKPKKALRLAADLSGEPASQLFANWPVVEKYLTKKILDIVREQYRARQEFEELVEAVTRVYERG